MGNNKPIDLGDPMYLQKCNQIIGSTMTSSWKQCSHKRGVYRYIPIFFGLLKKKVYVCKSCRDVLSGRELKIWEDK